MTTDTAESDAIRGLEITKDDWPYPLKCNRHYLSIRRAANAWFLGYRLFDSEAMNAYFIESDIPYLAAVCLPAADRERLRDCCDVMALLIYRDDEFDAASGGERDRMIASASSALDDSLPMTDRWSAPFQDAWRRFVPRMSVSQKDRFIGAVQDYLAGCRQMTTATVAPAGLEAYLQIRRSSIGERIDLMLAEYGLGIDLTSRDLDRPLLRRIQQTHLDVVIAIQDLLSYRKERNDGTEENLIACLARLHDCSIPDAIDKTHALLRAQVAAYDDACQQMHATPWGAKAELVAYTEALRDFTSGVAAWTGHSVRYTQPCPRPRNYSPRLHE